MQSRMLIHELLILHHVEPTGETEADSEKQQTNSQKQRCHGYSAGPHRFADRGPKGKVSGDIISNVILVSGIITP